MSEYLDHLNSQGSMVSSTLSSVLREQTALVSGTEEISSLTAKITCGDIEIFTDDVQDVSFLPENDVSVSFYAGKSTMLASQKLLRNIDCNVSCGSIERDKLECVSWEVSKLSMTSFVVTLKFKNC